MWTLVTLRGGSLEMTVQVATVSEDVETMRATVAFLFHHSIGEDERHDCDESRSSDSESILDPVDVSKRLNVPPGSDAIRDDSQLLEGR